MIIVFGVRTARLKTDEAKVPCNSCGFGTQQTFVISRYFHIFWIPVLAYKKSALAVCPHCLKATPEKEADTNLQEALRYLRTRVATPVYYFIGSAAIAGGVVYELLGTSGNV